MRIALVLVLSCTAAAAEPALCRGDARLPGYAGFYAMQTVVAHAHRTRSWPLTVASARGNDAGLVVSRKDVLRVEGWHEQATGGHCITPDGNSVWFHVRNAKAPPVGPYLKIADAERSLPNAYLNLIAGGCYAASDGSRWCIDSTGVSVDGKPLTWRFELDLAELPEYGTSLINRKAPNPLIVLAPTKTGFDAYKDTWLSADSRQPTGPGQSKPWVTLRPVQ